MFITVKCHPLRIYILIKIIVITVSEVDHRSYNMCKEVVTTGTSMTLSFVFGLSREKSVWFPIRCKHRNKNRNRHNFLRWEKRVSCSYLVQVYKRIQCFWNFQKLFCQRSNRSEIENDLMFKLWMKSIKVLKFFRARHV